MPSRTRVDGEIPDEGGARGEKSPAPLVLRLYVAASAPNSEQAQANLRAILARARIEGYTLEIIDCIREPLRALQDGVVVTPMLFKLSPEPVQGIVGTLSDTERVALSLGIADRLVGEGGNA